MAEAVLICGRIASGKSWYARMLMKNRRMVLLSVDEITLDILGGDLGARHDEIASKIQTYLYGKSLEILRAGTDVILDWGFWTEDSRSEARMFYQAHGISCSMHYIDIPVQAWEENIEERNRAVLAGKVRAYLLDDGLRRKLEAAFEPPRRDEIDVWYVNCRE